jgi:hypothetical protein
VLCCDDILDVFVAWRLVVKRRIYLRDATVRFNGGCHQFQLDEAMVVARYANIS